MLAHDCTFRSPTGRTSTWQAARAAGPTPCRGQRPEPVRHGRRAVGFESSARLLVHNVDFCRGGSADAARTTVHQAVL